jgi:hypothetical protein
MKKKVWMAVKAAAAAGGAYLCFRLVVSAGWREILDAFASHGGALAILTLVYTLYHILRTITLRICTPHPVKFAYLFVVRLAGEAIAYVAVGSILGDALKVVLGRKRIPVVEGATGVFAEKLIYHLSGAGFIIGGLLVAVIHFGAHPVFLGALAAMALLFLGFLSLLSSGARPIARILSKIKERNPALRKAILRTEESLFQFRKERPREFLQAFVLNWISYFYSVGEVFFILYLLRIPCSFWDLWYYQAIVKIMSAASMVVPANLGVFEATNVFLAEQMQFGNQAGMIVALFIRIRAILWSLIGYLCFLFLMKDE